MEMLGAVIGNDKEGMRQWVLHKVEDMSREMGHMQHEHMPTHIMVRLVKYCIAVRMGYLTRTLWPHVTKEGAQVFDDIVKHAVLKKCEIKEGEL